MYVRYLSRGEEEDDRGSDDERRWSRSSSVRVGRRCSSSARVQRFAVHVLEEMVNTLASRSDLGGDADAIRGRDAEAVLARVACKPLDEHSGALLNVPFPFDVKDFAQLSVRFRFTLKERLAAVNPSLSPREEVFAVLIDQDRVFARRRRGP